MNFKRVKGIIGDETKTIYDESMISIHKEKRTCVRVSLGKVIDNCEWKTKLRNASKTMTKIRWLGAGVFNNFSLHNIINRKANIKEKNIVGEHNPCMFHN